MKPGLATDVVDEKWLRCKPEPAAMNHSDRGSNGASRAARSSLGYEKG
jgi:hypothetical protein